MIASALAGLLWTYYGASVAFMLTVTQRNLFVVGLMLNAVGFFSSVICYMLNVLAYFKLVAAYLLTAVANMTTAVYYLINVSGCLILEIQRFEC